MHYTQNFHLPQWEGSDRVLMEDFNQLCTTLDSSMTDLQEGLGVATRLIKLREIVVPSGANGYTVDLSNLQLSRFAYVELYANLHNATKQTIYYTMNGNGDSVYQRDCDGNQYIRHYLTGDVLNGRLCIRLSPIEQSVLIETSGAIYEGTYYKLVNNVGVFHGSSFADMTSFRITGNPNQNETILVYGLLK